MKKVRVFLMTGQCFSAPFGFETFTTRPQEFTAVLAVTGHCQPAIALTDMGTARTSFPAYHARQCTASAYKIMEESIARSKDWFATVLAATPVQSQLSKEEHPSVYTVLLRPSSNLNVIKVLATAVLQFCPSKPGDFI